MGGIPIFSSDSYPAAPRLTALEFSHRTNDAKHQPARWCSQIEVISVADESYSQGFEFGQWR